jgi:predicted nuclease of predicted toxin-antitoxin system
MRFLVDRCAGHRLAEWLRSQGHDVLEARELGQTQMTERCSNGLPQTGASW